MRGQYANAVTVCGVAFNKRGPITENPSGAGACYLDIKSAFGTNKPWTCSVSMRSSKRLERKSNGLKIEPGVDQKEMSINNRGIGEIEIHANSQLA
jgi:hypothetical protein